MNSEKVTNKRARTTAQLNATILERWSPRSFADRPVEKEKIINLLEAARWAASSFNEQPWRFIIATRDQEEEYQRMLEVLMEGNQSWAASAPILVIAVTALNFERNGKPNRHHFHDVGLALGNLVNQATADGLFVHMMAGFDVQKAKDVYDIPGGFEAATALAIGYLGDPERLTEDWQKKSELAERNRKPLSELVFEGSFGQAARLAK